MKLWNLALAAAFVGAIAFAVPQAQAAKGGNSASHRKDADHGHHGGKGGNSAGHRKDGDHRQDGKHGNKGGKSADHRKDGSHRHDDSAESD
jgi:hypothetical protein